MYSTYCIQNHCICTVHTVYSTTMYSRYCVQRHYCMYMCTCAGDVMKESAQIGLNWLRSNAYKVCWTHTPTPTRMHAHTHAHTRTHTHTHTHILMYSMFPNPCSTALSVDHSIKLTYIYIFRRGQLVRMDLRLG